MQILSNPMVAQTIEACCTLAKIMLIIPVGSVENERQFSAMNFIIYARRNVLKEQHLNASCRIRRSGFTVGSRPSCAALA